MHIGFVGLGKLGLPCALAIESKGHSVVGYDVSEAVRENVAARRIPYREVGAADLLARSRIRCTSVEEVVGASELVFLAVQTPHDPAYEGITRIPDTRADFDYRYLKEAVASVAAAAAQQQKPITLAIISTVLPGTVDREVRPLLNEYTGLVYNPFFIAMGTTIADFLDPEFVLVGRDEQVHADRLAALYRTLHDRPLFVTDIATAELTKVAYNTFIGMKVVFANTVMEICQKTGANCDDVSAAIGMANRRLMSPKYLRGGMGDGGGCHPRDNIAMSWLAQQLGLSHDIFSDLMHAREDQTEWLAQLIDEARARTGLPVVILGRAFKAETNLVVGSPAVLLENLLAERGIAADVTDPHVDDEYVVPAERGPAVYFVATQHAEFATQSYPAGSVVLDPWGYVPDGDGVDVVRIGRGVPQPATAPALRIAA